MKAFYYWKSVIVDFGKLWGIRVFQRVLRSRISWNKPFLSRGVVKKSVVFFPHFFFLFFSSFFLLFSVKLMARPCCIKSWDQKQVAFQPIRSEFSDLCACLIFWLKFDRNFYATGHFYSVKITKGIGLIFFRTCIAYNKYHALKNIFPLDKKFLIVYYFLINL